MIFGRTHHYDHVGFLCLVGGGLPLNLPCNVEQVG